jgi:hypothetical protein
MSNETVKATVYLQVEPERTPYYDADDVRGIRGAKVVNATQKRSARPKGGTVEVKIAIELPKAAFLPLRPEATVVVPESLTAPHPVEVVAEDANGADA